MNRWRWVALRGLQSLGLPGWAALALLGLMAGVLLLDVLPTARQAEALQARVLALSARPSPPRAAVALPESAQAQWARFQQRLEDADGIGRSLNRLQAAAVRQGLQLPQGDFKLLQVAGEPVARYTMDLALTADYRALRRFIRDVLREQPALALESLSLQRTDSAPGQVDARLRWVLFMRAAAQGVS